MLILLRQSMLSFPKFYSTTQTFFYENIKKEYRSNRAAQNITHIFMEITFLKIVYWLNIVKCINYDNLDLPIFQ